MNLKDYKPGTKINLLSIGYSGSGKTIGSASFPNPLIFDLDQRIKPLKQFFDNRDDIDIESYGPFEFQRFWDRLKKLYDGDVRNKTYVVSSLTSLAHMAINFGMENRSPGTGKSLKNIPITDIADYGAEASLLNRVIAILRTIDANLIVEAHLVETTSKKKTSSKDFMGEDITIQRIVTAGKTIAAEIPNYFDETYYFYKVDKVEPPCDYKISTMPMNGVEVCKTALGLPGQIDFTMQPGGEGLYQKIVADCKSRGMEL